jgi:hypothetical protein
LLIYDVTVQSDDVEKRALKAAKCCAWNDHNDGDSHDDDDLIAEILAQRYSFSIQSWGKMKVCSHVNHSKSDSQVLAKETQVWDCKCSWHSEAMPES